MSEVIAAHNEAANKHLCKFSSQATKIHSLEDLCKTQDALRDKLTEFGAQRMEKLISEACSAELRAELYQFDLPKSDEPSLQSESSGTTGSGSREQSENGAPIPTSQPEQPRPVLNERSLRS